MKPREMTPLDAAVSLRKIADEHEAWVATTSTPSEAGYHMARMLVLRTAADLLTGDGHTHQRSDAVDPVAPRRQKGPTRDKDDLAAALRSLASQPETILDRWDYSGQPSVASFNHAVDVANANYARAERAEAALRSLASPEQEKKQEGD